ncbi:MAG TPA: hypothetical protein VFD58_10850 [Blastocatellia bacterium]|nr:hypothetical protein [Blastocatellia bacterium]
MKLKDLFSKSGNSSSGQSLTLSADDLHELTIRSGRAMDALNQFNKERDEVTAAIRALIFSRLDELTASCESAKAASKEFAELARKFGLREATETERAAQACEATVQLLHQIMEEVLV